MFSDHLKTIISSVDGAIACSVMGFDGIAVETLQPDATAKTAGDLELSTAWIEFANLLTQLKNVALSLKTGAVAEVSLNTEKCITLMRMVNNDYFLLLALLPGGNYGKARYVLRTTAPLVAKDL